MEKLNQTLSLCPTCMKVVPADIIEDEGKVFMQKECCGSRMKFLIDNDAFLYKKIVLPFKLDTNIEEGQTESQARKNLCKIRSTMVLYVTSRCNLKCPICYQSMSGAPDLSMDELETISKNSKSRFFVLSGGEPTVRDDLPQIIETLTKSNHIVSMTTNGLKFTDIDYLRKLKDSGLREVYLSFDGFDDIVYKTFRGRELLAEKVKILKNLKRLDVPTSLFCVIKKGFNEKQIKKITKYAMENNFIELVYFCVLNEYIHTQTPKTTLTDVYKAVSSEMNINMSCFIRWRRLYKLFYTLTKDDAFASHSFLFKIDKGHLERTDNVLDFLKIVMSYIPHRYFNSFRHELLKANNFLKVWIAEVYSPESVDLCRRKSLPNGTEVLNDGSLPFPRLPLHYSTL